MKRFLVAVFAAPTTTNWVSSHGLWTCPKPRSFSSGLKTGPCGDEPFDPSAPPPTVLSPGLNTVYFQETIVHRGSPYRIALFDLQNPQAEPCVLLDHIPHDDNGENNDMYGVTINIPNIQCDHCVLQWIQFMTDKVVDFCYYNPLNTTSFDHQQCGSNYHSCADVKINGSLSFSPALCSPQPQGFTQNPQYFSNEAKVWVEIGKIKYLLDSYFDLQARMPVVGLCLPNGKGDYSVLVENRWFDWVAVLALVFVILTFLYWMKDCLMKRRRSPPQTVGIEI